MILEKRHWFVNGWGRVLVLVLFVLWGMPVPGAEQTLVGASGRDGLMGQYRQVSDWRLAYNVGVNLLDAEEHLQAKVWFLKAWRNSLGAEQTLRALRYPEQWFPRSPESPLREPALAEAWATAFMRLISQRAMKIWGLVFSLLISLVLFWGFRSGWGRLKTHLLVVLTLLTLIWGGALGLRLWDTGHPRLGLVLRETWVTSAPSEEGTPLVMIAPGQEVAVMERQSTWIQVKWGEYAGWAQKAGVEVIP